MKLIHCEVSLHNCILKKIGRTDTACVEQYKRECDDNRIHNGFNLLSQEMVNRLYDNGWIIKDSREFV